MLNSSLSSVCGGVAVALLVMGGWLGMCVERASASCFACGGTCATTSISSCSSGTCPQDSYGCRGCRCQLDRQGLACKCRTSIGGD